MPRLNSQGIFSLILYVVLPAAGFTNIKLLIGKIG